MYVILIQNFIISNRVLVRQTEKVKPFYCTALPMHPHFGHDIMLFKMATKPSVTHCINVLL